MKRLQNNLVLIGGGAGAIGEGLTKYFLEEGARVIVPSRSIVKISQLKQYVGSRLARNLIPYETDVADAKAASALKESLLHQYGMPDIVVASLGGWWQGVKLIDAKPNAWQQVLADNLSSHFTFARAFLPVLMEKNAGIYIQLNGFTGETPCPNASLSSICSAALMMMSQVMAEELKPLITRVYQLILGPVNTRARETQRPEWFSPSEIAEYIINLYQGHNAYADETLHRLYHKNQKSFYEQFYLPGTI